MPTTPARKLGPDDATRPDLDLRAAARQECSDRPELRLVTSPDLARITALARDVSALGVGLLCEVPVGPGTPLAILWDYGPARECRTVRAVAAHLTPRPGGGWIVGAAFDEQLGPAEVAALLRQDREEPGQDPDRVAEVLAAAAPPAPRNRRLSPRKPPKGRVKLVCHRGSLDLGKNLGAALLDVSETGARLLLREGMGEGQRVLLALEGMGHLRPIKVSGTVVWARPAEGGVLAGVRFDKYLSWADLNRLT